MRIRGLIISAVFFGLLSTAVGTNAALAAEQPVARVGAYCVLTVNYPHASTHYSGTINVTATTTCPIPMTSIYIDTELKRTAPTAGSWWNGFGVTTYGLKSATDNQATSCAAGPGTYRGWATTRIVVPPGYVLTGPPYDSKYGTAVAVACGVNKSLAAIPMDVAEVRIEFERVD
jgi:hypothetical protein